MENNLKYASIYMYSTCNYDCSYCSGSQGLKEGFGRLGEKENMKRVLKFFKKRGPWHIGLVGGEPMIYPYFLEFCENLTEDNHKLSIITNLSKPIDQFISKIKPEDVISINCSLQPKGEKNVRTFINKVKKLKKAGFSVQVSYVATPERVGHIMGYFKTFKEIDIPFLVQPLIGIYDQKKYPWNYTESEKSLIRKYQLSVANISALENPGGRKTTGKKCKAGFSYLYIDARSGDIFPCQNLRNKIIGNIYNDELILFPKEIICSAKTCSCWLDSESERLYKKITKKCFENCEPVSESDWKEFKKIIRPLQNYEEYWNKKEGDILSSLFPSSLKRIVIYGGGIHTVKLLTIVKKHGLGENIVGIIDQDSEKWGQKVDGVEIHSLQEINILNPEKIVISSKAYEEQIFNDLKERLSDKILLTKIYNGQDIEIV